MAINAHVKDIFAHHTLYQKNAQLCAWYIADRTTAQLNSTVHVQHRRLRPVWGKLQPRWLRLLSYLLEDELHLLPETDNENV